MNVMNRLTFYRKNSTWVYDDPTYERIAEPLVANADVLLDKIMQHQLGYVTRKPGVVSFSDRHFPGSVYGTLIDSTQLGSWYELNGERAWLCPALFDYYPTAPQQLYVKVEGEATDEY